MTEEEWTKYVKGVTSSRKRNHHKKHERNFNIGRSVRCVAAELNRTAEPTHLNKPTSELIADNTAGIMTEIAKKAVEAHSGKTIMPNNVVYAAMRVLGELDKDFQDIVFDWVEAKSGGKLVDVLPNLFPTD